MPSRRNIELLEQLENYFREYTSFVLVDCTGLDVPSVNQLRRKIDAVGSLFKVSKNRLMKLALTKLNNGTLPFSEDWLRGPSGVILIKDDPIPLIKVIDSFRRDKEEKPAIKGLFLFGRDYPAEDFPRFAALPGTEEVKAQVVGVLKQPLNNLVGRLAYLIQHLLMVLGQIKDKSEQ